MMHSIKIQNRLYSMPKNCKTYDKEVAFILPIVYFSYAYRNIPVAYGVYSSQLKRYSCVCSSYEDDRRIDPVEETASMVQWLGVIALSAVDRGFEPRSGQTKE